MRKWKKGLREECLKAYGGVCACCGEDHLQFLTIDHIDNDGAAHRKALKLHTGAQTYGWLKSNNWPEGFQVLCYNCNCAKGAYGQCPHEGESHRDRGDITWR
jgi:hypothetical protein